MKTIGTWKITNPKNLKYLSKGDVTEIFYTELSKGIGTCKFQSTLTVLLLSPLKFDNFLKRRKLEKVTVKVVFSPFTSNAVFLAFYVLYYGQRLWKGRFIRRWFTVPIQFLYQFLFFHIQPTRVWFFQQWQLFETSKCLEVNT